jgi:gliding motility-associated-like protein
MKPHCKTHPFYFIVIFTLLVLLPKSSFAQCDCDFIISLSGTEYTFDGEAKGVEPGDKICFTSGTRTGFGFVNVHGTAENPVIITNMCDGKVVLSAPSNWGNTMEVNASSHFRITGSGNPNEEYGIEITGAQMGLNVHGLSTNFEIDHVNVHDVGCVGIVGKTDPTCDPATWRGNFTMRDSKFHHNKIANTGCEGFYIGNSHYDAGKVKTCLGVPTTVFEHDLINIEVYNNDLRNIGNDGIQVGGAKNATIHHNYVYNAGVKNNAQHQNLIQVGDGSQAVVYNNTVDTGKGYGLYDAGGGSTYYNNVVMNALQGGMLLQDTPLGHAPVGFTIINNTFINNKDFGVLMFSENLKPSFYINNIVVGQNQATYKYVNFNNAVKNIWIESTNIRTQDITTVKFVDPSGKDFRLQPGAAAIDGGTDIAAYGVTFDLDERTRPRNGKYDIGAYEFQPSGPTSNAGDDQNIVLPTNSTIINGSGTSVTGVTGYLWTKKSGGNATLTNEATATLSVADLEEGTYVFELRVTDVNGFEFDEMTINVLPPTANQNPVANAGEDQTITLPLNAIALNGIGTDADGTITKYEWIKVSGPEATLSGATTANLALSTLLEGDYVFQLTVTDDKTATASDQVSLRVNAVGVNQSPVVNAGSEKSVFLPNTEITITATASDPDGTISLIAWEKKSGGTATLTNTNTLSLTAASLALGSYTFRITVTDNNGATASSEVVVKVLQANQSPTANAGPNQPITLPTNSITLTGSGEDPDGTITSYTWVKVSGPSATLTNANTAVLEVTDMVQGAYVFGLTVTDNNNATGYDEVTIALSVASTGPNENPLAIAGGNTSFSLPTNAVNLYGAGFDADGTIVSYAWTKASGGAATLVNPDKPTLTVTGLQTGQYIFRLTVTDDKGATDEDDAVITVSEAGTNIFPVALAGVDKFVRLPQNSLILNGSGTDADGQITAYEWTKVSGGNATISTPSASTTTVLNLTEGTYVFRLTVTDDDGATDLNDVTVRVVSSTNNLPPVVSAGSDATIYLPQTTLTINATATDDGSITTYQWVKLSGPSVTLVNPTELNLALEDLVQGEYTFQLTVADNSAASVFDIVKVSVLPASFSPPVVNAGDDQEITLPVNQTTLTGTASSPAGIVSTKWVKTVGPAATLGGDNTLTLQLSGMVEGTYVFKLTVIDNDGKEVSDNVQVIVNPIPPNQVPIVDAGINQSLLLPVSQVNLTGTAIDTDGTISSVQWSQVQGPSSATLENQTTLNLTVRNVIEGTYIFRLTATDNEGASGSGDVIVFIADPLSSDLKSPLVFAGEDVLLIAPDINISISGNAFDPDGTIESYEWTQISGTPATFTVAENVLQFTGVQTGTYGFRFTATDNDLLSASDDILISVINENDEIPKFFSPNSDGNGDTWSFRNVDNYADCDIKIFNRTGREVYSAKPYQNNWDGMNTNGSPVDDGDYYYILSFPDGRQVKGALRVIR